MSCCSPVQTIQCSFSIDYCTKFVLANMKDMVAVWKLEQWSELRQEAWCVLNSAELLCLLSVGAGLCMHREVLQTLLSILWPLNATARDGLGDIYSSSGYPLAILAIGSWASGGIEVERALWKRWITMSHSKHNSLRTGWSGSFLVDFDSDLLQCHFTVNDFFLSSNQILLCCNLCPLPFSCHCAPLVSPFLTLLLRVLEDSKGILT